MNWFIFENLLHQCLIILGVDQVYQTIRWLYWYRIISCSSWNWQFICKDSLMDKKRYVSIGWLCLELSFWEIIIGLIFGWLWLLDLVFCFMREGTYLWEFSWWFSWLLIVLWLWVLLLGLFMFLLWMLFDIRLVVFWRLMTAGSGFGHYYDLTV